MFFVITSQKFYKITGNEEMNPTKGPIFGIINPDIRKHFFIAIDYMKMNYIYYAKTNDSIEFNIESLTNLSRLHFDSKSRYLEHLGNETEILVFLVLPAGYEAKLKINILDDIELDCKDSYTVPKKTSKLIYCKERFKRGTYFGYFNRISTYTSNNKNMRLSIYDIDEKTDYIIQNYEELPIIAGKADNDYIINVTNYLPKFTVFGAENNYIFKVFFNMA